MPEVPPPVGFDPVDPESVDALLAVDLESLAADGRGNHLVRLAKAQAALDAHQLEVTARWDAGLDWSGQARSAGAWLAPRCGLTKAVAGHRVKVARTLRRAPLAHKSLAAGRLTFPKVALLEKHLETDRHWDAHGDAEADVVAVLETLTVEQCAEYLHRWARAADPDWAQKETERRDENRCARLSTTLGGVGYLTADLTARATFVILSVLQNITDEMRRADRDTLAPGERRTEAQLAHDALEEMARRAADWKTEKMPGSAPSVTLVLTWAALTEMADTELVDTTYGPPITAADARRLACDAGIARFITGPHSEPLDLGREKRLYSPAQRKAIHARFGGCAGPGCTTPPQECDIHHVDEWLPDDGETNILNGLPLGRTCGCHDRIHNRTWHVTMDAHGWPTLTDRYSKALPDPRRAMLELA